MTNTEVTTLTDENNYYQILIVKPRPGKTEPKHINVEIVTKKKAEFSQIESYPSKEENSNELTAIGDYLPSNGLVFTEGFIKKIFSDQEQINLQEISKVNDFYSTTRSLYITRKISQLLAKSWYAYLTATATRTWDNFICDNWQSIDPEILDGLIIREILLFDNQYSPDSYEFEKDLLNKYYEHAKTLILPASKAWQGICLSLLLGGQVYYEMDADDKSIYQDAPNIKNQLKYYRRVSQPILSTFEMVNRYAMEVNWNTFQGDIQELQINPNQTDALYKAIIPYPPIPSERNLSMEDIKKWADAKDDELDNPLYDSVLPFYDKRKTNSGEEIYELNVKYVSPPFPYLPLSTS
ncbi:hypothetical protein [Anabaena sp. PCC 7108]|uniref:hypothetical protein n=1 Tax=Anabaena sp. PCC 7108 TaxID=163908 RepID=UPI00034C91D0|nr:hypothetical protein [Anabaena sp. PCC 7108]